MRVRLQFDDQALKPFYKFFFIIEETHILFLILYSQNNPSLCIKKGYVTPLLCDGVKRGNCPVPRVEDSTPWG